MSLLFRAIVALTIVFTIAGFTCSSFAEPALKTGSHVMNEYTESVKTAGGKHRYRIRVEYNWDEGATYTHRLDDSGEIVETSIVYGAPSPEEHEVDAAIAIVSAHPDVKDIQNRQSGIAIAGGFPFESKTGVCARPARCLQIFLFDAENVVRHMLVDLRSSKVVATDYVPPQNLRTGK